jgi:hypothetical protein
MKKKPDLKEKAKGKGDSKVTAKAKKKDKPQDSWRADIEARVAVLEAQLPTATRTSGGEDVTVTTGRVGGSVPLEQHLEAERKASVPPLIK